MDDATRCCGGRGGIRSANRQGAGAHAPRTALELSRFLWRLSITTLKIFPLKGDVSSASVLCPQALLLVIWLSTCYLTKQYFSRPFYLEYSTPGNALPVLNPRWLKKHLRDDATIAVTTIEGGFHGSGRSGAGSASGVSKTP